MFRPLLTLPALLATNLLYLDLYLQEYQNKNKWGETGERQFVCLRAVFDPEFQNDESDNGPRPTSDGAARHAQGDGSQSTNSGRPAVDGKSREQR